MTSFIPIERTARRLAEVCSFATVSVAGLALLSWGLGHWQLWAFGGGYVPMAPSTALALLLLNSAILLRNRWPDRPVTVRCGFLVAAAVALFGLLVLLQKPAGFELPAEKWLAHTADTVGGIPVGRMSPLTAFTFLLAAGALLFGQPPFRRRRLCNCASHALALLALLTGVVFVLGYAAGTPLWYSGQTIPMALLTAVSFLLTGLGLLAAGLGPDLQRLQNEGWLLPAARASGRFAWFLLAAFVVLAAAIGSAAFFGLRRQQAHARQTVQEELAAIADLKVGQIVNWRYERLADARFFSKAPMVARDVQSFLADPSSEAARAETLGWLTLLKAGDRYAQVTLCDSRLDPRLSVPPLTNDPSAWLRAQMTAAFLTNDVVMTDLRREETGREIHLDIFFPVFAPSTSTPLPAQAVRPATASPLAVILLRLDPRRFLYPLIQSWPTPSRTAETVLVRREGEEVVFLNELRHRTNTALNLRFSASQADLPAALVARGQEGVAEGRDYRGVPVLTAFRQVPDSPWFLGAKVDQAEIYRPLRRQAVAVGSVVAVLLVAVALGLGLVSRQRDTALLSRELASQRERQALAERFAHLMQHANDIILLADENLRILEANERALQTYGYSLSELQQMHLPDLRPPAARAGFARDVERLREQGSTVFETLHQRNDGSAFPVEVSARLVEIGGVNYKLSILRDITERNRAEEKLRESEKHYRSLFDNMLNGFAYCRMLFEDDRPQDFIYLEVNDAFQALTGLGNVAGRKVSEVIPGIRESDPELFEIYGRVALTGKPERFETWVKSLRMWFSISVYCPERGYFVAVFDVITERKRYESRLQQLNEVIQKLAAARDLDSIRAAVRSAARHLTGADGATFVLRDGDQCLYADEDTISPLWKGQRFPMSACISGWVMLNRQPAVIEDIYSDPRIPVEAYRPTFVKSLAMVPIRSADPVGAIGNYWARTYTPTPEEIQLLQTLADAAAIAMENVRLYNELEQRVAQRTVELAAANQELESFAYSVSHDLRAPLRHIHGFCDLLQKHLGDRLDERGRRYLGTVSDAAKRMGILIDDLLSFSRMGRTEMRQAEVRLEELVQEVIHRLQPESAGRPVEWKTGPLPAVQADRALLRQVFVNLLSNALKYTRPRDPARIEIGCRKDEALGTVVFVRDNGVGFDPAYAHKLFGVFQRLHRTEEFEGTGIGLANVHRIILRHGGRTWAEGQPGEGATFYFSLPGCVMRDA